MRELSSPPPGKLRWSEEGDVLGATVGRPRQVAVFWAAVLVFNALSFTQVARADSPVFVAYIGVALVVMLVLAVRAYLFRATLALREGRLRCTVGPLAWRASVDLPLAEIAGFEVLERPRQTHQVVVRRVTGESVPLKLPLDGVKIGPRGSATVWFGAAPVEQHRFVAAWLETALTKARRAG